MTIDFHVHFFPDNIAERALDHLSTMSGVMPYGDGTFDSLSAFMKKADVDLAVNQPVATNPEQVISINRKMIDIIKMNGGITSFGSMHPGFRLKYNPAEELSYIASKGIKGIKLHCEYQDFYPDDEKLTPVYEACSKNGLIILFHSGRDIGFTSLHATPERLLEVSRVRGIRLVLAHMGAYRLWDEVEKFLLGVPNVYFDTAFTMEMDSDQMKSIIMGHGSDKIIFGSDFPWENPALVREKILGLNLGKETENKIFAMNACKLLNIN
jgi:hypothetical protein